MRLLPSPLPTAHRHGDRAVSPTLTALSAAPTLPFPPNLLSSLVVQPNMSTFIVFVLLALLIAGADAHPSRQSHTAATYAYPLSASGSRLVDANNRTVQMRCANWPGHMETMLPEGLQWQPLSTIVQLLVAPGTFNCIRLSYSVELFYAGANLTARQSFARLGLNDTIAAVEANNPSLIDLPLLTVRDAVVGECGKAGIMVLFDNQVSKSEWCCSTTDGNGWWNDRYFNVTEWLYSLHAISSHYASIAPNAVAYSLRNELRTDKPRADQVSDWLTYVPQGMDALHSGDPNALIFVSGLNYDCDWTFLDSLARSTGSPVLTAAPPANDSEWQRVYTDYADKLTFESHIYAWDGFGTYTENCSLVLPGFDQQIGHPQRVGRPHVLTEIGLSQDVYPNDQDDYLYFHCVSRWILDNQLGFGIWLFGGRSHAPQQHTAHRPINTRCEHSVAHCASLCLRACVCASATIFAMASPTSPTRSAACTPTSPGTRIRCSYRR